MHKLRINRRGLGNEMQIALVSVAAILVLIFFLYQAYTGLQNKMAIQSCKDSISAHSFVATATSRDVFTDIKCPTKEITIKDLKKANAIIAEDMHRCWYIWGEGKGQYFESDGTFCQICSIYQFGDKRRTVSGFANYLATQPIQVTYPGDTAGISYQDYFQGYSTPYSAEKVKSNYIRSLSENDFLNTSQKYATIFVYASGKDKIDKMLEGGGRTTLGTAGIGAIILGAAGGVYGLGALGVAVVSVTGAVAGGATVAAAVATANFWNPVGWVIGAGLLIGAGVYAAYTATHPGNPEWISFLAFRPYNVDELKNLSCEKLAVNQMSNSIADKTS